MADEFDRNPAEAADLDSDAASPQRRGGWKRRVTLVLLAVVLIVAAVVLPPLVNIGRYQRQITALMSRSLGRPVRLSGVELRLLPMPGFVLHDVSVSEDPSFGAEPILSARTVVATVKLVSLWRGKLEVSRVSVDEASLNLAQTAQGRWNLESVMMGVAQQPDSRSGSQSGRGKAAARPVAFPYLEATNSRVNLKNGAEKSPFSIVDTDLSLWQDEPGAWRVRLRGQPVRTDMDISLADTGEVRLEASVHSAAQMREMPLRVQMEWRDAQLGQLSRLLLGSDAGWRGDVTADVEVSGTPDAALTKARLRATGVRRQEFTPETPLDFDANCSFRYQHPQNALHDLDCNTAVGDGRLHLKAELPGRGAASGAGGMSEALLEVKQIPVQAGLDLLRTVRSDFAPGIAAAGLVHGSLIYKAAALPAEILTGSLSVQGGVLKGGGLAEPLTLPEVVWAPTMLTSGADMGKTGLGSRFAIPVTGSKEAGAQSIAVAMGLGSHGYSVGLGGSLGVAKLRELAYAFGLPKTDAADGFSSGGADLDLLAAGPWIETEDAASDSFTGTVQLHHALWKAGFLAGAVDLPQATVTLSPETMTFGSEFTYPAKAAASEGVVGAVTVTSPVECTTACEPHVELHFAALDAGVVQAAMLGVPAKRTLLSPFIDRMRSTDRPKWPEAVVNVHADSLFLGSVTLRKPSVSMHFKPAEVVFDTWQATLLGGEAHGTGGFSWSADHSGKPQYAFKGEFSQVSATALGALLGGRWSGGPVSGSGDVHVSGLTEKDLAATAAGDLDFTWAGGSFGAVPVASHAARLDSRFDLWTGKAVFANGGARLGDNSLTTGKHKASVEGGVTFGGPVKLVETDLSH